MKIYLVGLGYVGKSTIGKLLADKINYHFYDLDIEIEKYYQKSIENIQNECFSMNGFRKKGSEVLDHLLKKDENTVIAGTISGLRDAYLQVYKKHKKDNNLISVWINDRPENIVNRLKFYDFDSNPIHIDLDEPKKQKYLKRIKEDLNYFKKSLSRADFTINIADKELSEISELICEELKIKTIEIIK